MPPKAATRSSTRTKSTAIPSATTRTTRATAKAAPATEPSIGTTATKKTTARKPLVNRVNADETANPPSKPPAKSRSVNKINGKVTPDVGDHDREPIVAFLRIRPNLTGDATSSQPYLTHLNDTSVRMTDPNVNAQSNSRFRTSTVPPSSIYTFSHIFPPTTTQADFFAKTTLPLVHDVLYGQNGLLFAYGVTNSGKTFTIQGGANEGSAGILPRTLDVIFNSIEGLHADGKFRPVRLHGIELADPSDSRPPRITPAPALTQVLGQTLDDGLSPPEADIDPTVLKLDRNYQYSIWLSYAEVYNEKIYDLLDNAADEPSSNIPRSTSNSSLLLTRKALNLRPSPLDDTRSDTPGKYISGLKQFRVHNAAEAKSLVKMGQLHRRVFGTLANRESSRSHGVVILKVVRGHRGEKNDPTALQVSRLTLVDLAGSERTKNTQTTGDRLKEAGNINKSLMVLGQCMEVMRSNQRRLAASLAHEGFGIDGRMDTRDVKRGLAVVPFRHSKLTELLMDYFVGDGRVVMIVNVNPYDTGYDENSHVMKFAALAREVYVTPAPAPMQRVPATPRKSQTTRKVTIETAGPGRKSSTAVLTVLEEEEADDEGQGNDSAEYSNPLVDALFDEIESLHLQLFECELKCAVIEAEAREEVMKEMEERMRSMERMYARRLMNEVERSEMKTDAKIEFLHQSGLFNSPVKQPRPAIDEGSVEDEQLVLSGITEATEDDETELVASGEEIIEESDLSDLDERSPSPSFRQPKSKQTQPPITKIRYSMGRKEVVQTIPEGPSAVKLPSDEEEGEVTGTEQEGYSGGEDGQSTEEDLEEEDEELIDSDDEWRPEEVPKHSKDAHKAGKSADVKKSSTKTTKRKSSSVTLQESLDLLSLEDPDESVVAPLPRKFRPRIESLEEETEEEDEIIPKKAKAKRKLGKKPVLTEEQVERAAGKVDRLPLGKTANIRRLTGRVEGLMG